jgi:hypothetical protein
MSTNKKDRYYQRRERLKELSAGAQLLVKEGAYASVNEFLIEMYKENDPGITEFNTYVQWREKGFQVQKGSEAYLVWGKPHELKNKDKDPKNEESEEEDEFKYFPVCYLFANTQVKPIAVETVQETSIHYLVNPGLLLIGKEVCCDT